MFLSLDGTFWIQLINFAIFFALLNVLFLRPVGAAIKKRREYIDAVTGDYAKYQADANALREQAERVRAEARREAEGRLAKARAEASNQTAELAAKYSAEVQATVEQAQRKASDELTAARAGEEQLVERLSNLMVDRTLSEAAP